MTLEEIRLTVNQAMAEEFELEPDQMTPEASLNEDLNLDSLDMVDLVMVIEHAFKFKLPDRRAVQHIKTLQDIYDFVYGLQERNNENQL